jgi:hypothetical protein
LAPSGFGGPAAAGWATQHLRVVSSRGRRERCRRSGADSSGGNL